MWLDKVFGPILLVQAMVDNAFDTMHSCTQCILINNLFFSLSFSLKCSNKLEFKFLVFKHWLERCSCKIHRTLNLYQYQPACWQPKMSGWIQSDSGNYATQNYYCCVWSSFCQRNENSVFEEMKITNWADNSCFLDKRLKKIIQTGVKYDFMAGRLKWG